MSNDSTDWTGRKDRDPLEPNEVDRLSAITQSGVSLIPLVGGVIATLIAETIPNQRADRLAKYIRKLETRIETLEAKPAEVFADPEKVDLIEEGAWQATRATSEDRIERIATLVASQLEAGEVEAIRLKRLAHMLRQIDDDELVLLNAYGQSYGANQAAWEAVNRPEPAALGSSAAVIDNEKLYEAGRDNLLRLGLLQKKYKSVPRGQTPEFDSQKGDFQHSVQISYLGRMLLRYIGLPSPFDDGG